MSDRCRERVPPRYWLYNGTSFLVERYDLTAKTGTHIIESETLRDSPETAQRSSFYCAGFGSSAGLK